MRGEDIEGPTLEAPHILKICRRKIEEAEDDIEIEEIRTGFKSWDEKTSTSPSGIHLRIYKSLTENNKQEEENLYLLKKVARIFNGAKTRGITLERWCLVHNVLLEKDPNNPTIHRLRIIYIIEADYDLATKLF